MTPLPTTFLLPDLGGGGAQRVMLSIAGGLDRTRFAPRLLVLGGAQTFAGDLPDGLDVEIGRTRRVRDGLPWMLRRLRAQPPAVVVSVMGYLNLALLASRPLLPRGTRIVVREANVLAATAQALPGWLPVRALYRRLYPAAAAVVSPSERIAAELTGHAPRVAPRLAVIPNPVDEDGLRHKAARARRAPGAGLRLVAAGRLTHQKGFDRLIEVMARLDASAHLTILGAGPDRAALAAQIAARGLADRIDLAGFSAELPAWIAGADAFLLPSRWEGLPNVVLESLALGTPVIASAEAAVEEVRRAAPAGALSIGAPEQSFVAAIAALPGPSQALASPRPSLLPEAYRRDVVVGHWSRLLARLADTPLASH